MHILGLIVEFNPFHLGHQYFINEAKKLVNPELTIAVTSTTFSMRGDLALTSKKNKVQIMLDQNIDIIMELPITKYLERADLFSENAIRILSDMGVTDFVCGSEIDCLDDFKTLYQITHNTTFLDLLKSKCQNINLNSKSYKTLYLQILYELKVKEQLIDIVRLPNSSLAFHYYEAIQKLNTPINFFLLKRSSDHHTNLINNDLPSGSAIVNEYRYGHDITPYLAFDQNKYPILNIIEIEHRLFLLIKYYFSSHSLPFVNNYRFTEGIEFYVNKYIFDIQEYQLLLDKLATPRYSKTRFKRLFIGMLLDLPKSDPLNSYLRPLGLTKNGISYLKLLPKEIKDQLISKIVRNTNIDLNNEINTSRLISILVQDNQLLLDEYLFPIVR